MATKKATAKVSKKPAKKVVKKVTAKKLAKQYLLIKSPEVIGAHRTKGDFFLFIFILCNIFLSTHHYP